MAGPQITAGVDGGVLVTAGEARGWSPVLEPFRPIPNSAEHYGTYCLDWTGGGGAKPATGWLTSDADERYKGTLDAPPADVISYRIPGGVSSVQAADIGRSFSQVAFNEGTLTLYDNEARETHVQITIDPARLLHGLGGGVLVDAAAQADGHLVLTKRSEPGVSSTITYIPPTAAGGGTGLTQAQVQDIVGHLVSAMAMFQYDAVGKALSVAPKAVLRSYLADACIGPRQIDAGTTAKRRALRRLIGVTAGAALESAYRIAGMERTLNFALSDAPAPLNSNASVVWPPWAGLDTSFVPTITDWAGVQTVGQRIWVEDIMALAQWNPGDAITPSNSIKVPHSNGTDAFYYLRRGDRPYAASSGTGAVQYAQLFSGIRIGRAALASGLALPATTIDKAQIRYDLATGEWEAFAPSAGGTDAAMLQPLSALPAKAGLSAQALVNYGGDLLELVPDTDDSNVLRGTAAAIGGGYVGVDTDGGHGSLADPDAAARIEWAPSAENIPLFKAGIRRGAWSGAVPAALYCIAKDRRTGQTVRTELSRAAGGDTAALRAFEAASTGDRFTAPAGSDFTFQVFEGADYASSPVAVHETALRWESWLARHEAEAPQRPAEWAEAGNADQVPAAKLPPILSEADVLGYMRAYALIATAPDAARRDLAHLMNAAGADDERIDYKALANLPHVIGQGPSLPLEDSVDDDDLYGLNRADGARTVQVYRAAPLGLTEAQTKAERITLARSGADPWTWEASGLLGWRLLKLTITASTTGSSQRVDAYIASNHATFDILEIGLSGAQFPAGTWHLNKGTHTATIGGVEGLLYRAEAATGPGAIRPDATFEIDMTANVALRPPRRWTPDMRADELALLLNAAGLLNRRSIHNIDRLPRFNDLGSAQDAYLKKLDSGGNLVIDAAVAESNDGTLALYTKPSGAYALGVVQGQAASGGTKGAVNRRNRLVVTLAHDGEDRAMFDRGTNQGSQRGVHAGYGSDYSIFLERAVVSEARRGASSGAIVLQYYGFWVRQSLYAQPIIVIDVSGDQSRALRLRRTRYEEIDGVNYGVYEGLEPNSSAITGGLSLTLDFFADANGLKGAAIDFQADRPEYTEGHGYQAPTGTAIARILELAASA